jgi:four helix bundle protein
MAEWFKAAVLKTVVLFTGDRGFKSYSLRQEISRREISQLACSRWPMAKKNQKPGFMERFRFQSFRVYQDAKEYCKFCRDITKRHVEKADRSLADQITRALNSIVLNIAEGSADQSDTEFARFLGIAIRSVYETVAGFDLGVLYGYVEKNCFDSIEDKPHSLVKQLVSFRQTLK